MTKPKQPTEPRWMKARSTSNARRAIAEFVDENSGDLSTWLTRIAHGIPKLNQSGEVVLDADGSTVWVVKPDCAGAIRAFGSVADFVMPRLNRSALTVEQVDLPLEQLSTVELQRRLFVQLGLVAEDAVEVVPQPLSADPTFAE